MTGRRRAGVLVGLVVLVAGVEVVRRAARPVRAVRRGMRVMGGAQLTAWYDPVWQGLEAAYHAFVTPAKWLTSVIIGWVSDVIQAVINGVDDVRQLVDLSLNALGSLADSVWTAITHITATLIPTLASSLYNFVGSVVSVARGELLNFITDVRNLATGLWQNALGEAHALVDQLAGTVGGWVDGLRSWVLTSVMPWAERLVSGAVSWVTPALDQLRGLVGNLVAGVRGWVAPVVDLVNAARTWLVWLATHPFDYWRSALDQLVHISARAFLDQFTRALASDGDEVERWLADVLG